MTLYWGCLGPLGVRHHLRTADASSPCGFSVQRRYLWATRNLGKPRVDTASRGAGCVEGQLRGSRWPCKADWKAPALVSCLTPQQGNLQVQHEHGTETPGVFPLSFLFMYTCKLCQWRHIFLLKCIFICFLACPGFHSEIFHGNSFNLLLLQDSHD